MSSSSSSKGQGDDENHEVHIDIDEFIEYVSKYVELNVGDILLSGTP